MPIIHQCSPSDYHTVYTSILTALAECKTVNQKKCVLNFDQPLYWKARDVVANESVPEMSNVVVRLGGFHLLMSFLGAMGTIMGGSGLKQLFCNIYAVSSQFIFVDVGLHQSLQAISQEETGIRHCSSPE